MTKDVRTKWKRFLVSIVMIVCSVTTVKAGSGEIGDIKTQLSDLEKRTAELEENQGQEKDSKDLRVFWKEGLNLTTQDKAFKLKIGGRLMTDWFWSIEDSTYKADVGNQEDGVEIRRARIYFSGQIYENIEYKLQLDFAETEIRYKDAYLEITDLPIGKLRMGQFYEPFCLETQTSSNYITFIERSLPTILAPDRQTGFMIYNNVFNERIYGAAGVFRQTSDTGENVDDGGYNITGRIAVLPIYKNKGESLLQFGAAYSYRNPDDTLRIRQRPEAHLAEYAIDTGTLACDRENLVGVESAWVNGPLSLQAEYMIAYADIMGASNAHFDGYYIEGSYFLTGEHRNYKTEEAVFSRVKPKNNFKYGTVPGAWELKLRYSALDLNNSGVSGGKLDDITAGVNWYLNPNTRIMWDYIHADKDDSGQANMFSMRLQFDF